MFGQVFSKAGYLPKKQNAKKKKKTQKQAASIFTAASLTTHNVSQCDIRQTIAKYED